jgi:hypothetical protein
MPYHSIRDDPSLDVDMVELLLYNGADPNQPVRLNRGISVWALFLLSIYETCVRETSGASSTYQSLNKAWYQACRALIRAGASSDCLCNSGHEGLNAPSMLNRVFGRDRAAVLVQEMEQKENEAQQLNSSCIAMYLREPLLYT